MNSAVSIAKKMAGGAAKMLGAATIVLFIIAAKFNLGVGFGAQEQDCIDGRVYIRHLEHPKVIDRGDLIVFVAPDRMGEQFADHLVIKKVGAVPGDRIRIEKSTLYINDVPHGTLDIAEKASKQLGVSIDSFERSEIVPNGYILAVGTKPRTYDGRYWGFLPVRKVIGSAYPVF